MTELRSLVERYLIHELDIPNPTQQDIDTHIKLGANVYGSAAAFLAALRNQYKVTNWFPTAKE